MPPGLIDLITSSDDTTRNRSLDEFCATASFDTLLAECEALDQLRHRSENLYERVRALFFLYAIHRFHLPARAELPSGGHIPFRGYEQLLQRRFEEAIELFSRAQKSDGPSDALSSALAAAYHRLAFQTLADQVRRSVRTVRGNQWMFRMGHPKDQPLRVRRELLTAAGDGSYPILRERTPVRMDLTHSAWSDIFFLGMDFPEGAKVLNVSVDLGVHGRDTTTQPPVSAWLRVIEEPVLRLVSVDLNARADISNLAEVFDFAKDYLGLLKAAVIASGVVPPGIEGSGQSLGDLLAEMLGPGRGLELVSSVNDIPKGSRLAVSTNLLAALIGVLMRATGQAESLTGPLLESERRLVLARALLGEWIGGSGGGWQDSGGVWPGIKLIQGVAAQPGDPEHGISRGRLMPAHHVFGRDEISAKARQSLQDSLVLVHGGMAQNVGPILEMVTEKYLLRSAAEWTGRQEALGILAQVLDALRAGDIARVGAVTTRNFQGPIQTIIPWASTYYTERLIEQVRAEFGADFWGFWMLGGMSGGGMGFIFKPERKAEAQQRLQAIMSATKRELQHALPFAMEPVVYDFAINENGSFADLLTGADALMPASYYTLTVPDLIRQDRRMLSPLRRTEIDKFGTACRTKPELRGMVQTLFDAMFPRGKTDASDESLTALLEANGFDAKQHEQVRAHLREGRIGLAQNRLPANAVIEDVSAEDVTDTTAWTREVGQPSRLSARAAAVPAAQPPPLFHPFDPKQPVAIHHRHLPHWRQDGATYFVTFRLADSIPAPILRAWQEERTAFLTKHAGELSPERRTEIAAFFHGKLEEQLDRGLGSCALRTESVASVIADAFTKFDGERYHLGPYVIMPNHVHVLVTPLGEHPLSAILHSWKSFTAHAINRALQRTGSLWQDESFDHLVRTESELRNFEAYIAENPAQGRLAAGEFQLGNLGSEQTAGTAIALADSRDGCATTERAAAARGLAALRDGEVAVVSLAAGAGSRWTQGAGVVKALHPFAKLAGRHRTFLETHLAKSRRMSHIAGAPIPHVFTTSYLTHEPTATFLAEHDHYGYEGPLLLSRGQSVGLRMVPTERDLRFAWEEMPQQMLDEQQQKVRDSLRTALIGWARGAGEASDYTDNLPLQCLHPVGHWFELPNLLRNGTLAQLLASRPQLKTLLLHNIDTLGADVDPTLLGQHLQSGAGLSFEVITRRLEDRGGGLARVNGRARLVEGLAMPGEEAEFALTYYNTLTTWIDLDRLLDAFGLTRADFAPGVEAEEKITTAIRNLATKMPTYITLKDVKKRWGHGQEDIFPVTQFEKLWGDMSALPEIDSRFLVVPRRRGQQLKDQAQLDGWLRDGSAAYVESLCAWR
jgi:UDP-N-acetylglucosamine pyrophosphorylase